MTASRPPAAQDAPALRLALLSAGRSGLAPGRPNELLGGLVRAVGETVARLFGGRVAKLEGPAEPFGLLDQIVRSVARVVNDAAVRLKRRAVQ